MRQIKGSLMRNFLWIATGTILGLVCAFGGLVVSAAGFGWPPVWPFGLLSLILTPWAFYRLGKFREISQRTNFTLLAIALALDSLLLAITLLFDYVESFYRMIYPALVWLSIWSIWQIAVIATILITRHRNYGDSTRQSIHIKKAVRQRVDAKRKVDSSI
jgi:hypothetical protein